MADFEKVNDVATSSIEKVNDIAKSSIEKINDMTSPSGTTTATLWVAGGNDRIIGHISNTNLLAGNNWSSYDAFSGGSSPNPSSSIDHINVAYGKDGSGNPLWVSTWESDNPELATHDDATTGPWTGINTDQDGTALSLRRFAIEWGNNVWIAVGKMGSSTKYIWRSTDGAAW